MPDYFILHSFSDADIPRALLDIEQLALARYDNPFEAKSFLEHKSDVMGSAALSYMFGELRSTDMVRTVQRLTNLPVTRADYRHYGGLFVYHTGDHLEPHVDAGVHPNTGERKVATACLYLTDAVLSMWQGDSCLQDDPEVWLENPIQVRAGECILFPNDDSAWHSVPTVPYNQRQRVCLTVSYMADPGFTLSRYQNPRTRAYFARHYGKTDTPEMALLRRQRASEEGREGVYRYGTDLADKGQY